MSYFKKPSDQQWLKSTTTYNGKEVVYAYDTIYGFGKYMYLYASNLNYDLAIAYFKYLNDDCIGLALPENMTFFVYIKAKIYLAI